MPDRPDLFVVRSYSLALPSDPPQWHGKHKIWGMELVGKPMPTGLKGWRSEQECRKYMIRAIELANIAERRRYEIVRMGPKKGTTK